MLESTTNETGQTNVEYALVICVTAIALAFAAVAANGPIGGFFTRVATTIAGVS